MPRFHFNVHDGFVRPDPTGKELPDLPAARGEAMHLADSLLRDDVDRVSLGEVWYLEVTDSLGSVLFRLDLHVSQPELGARRGHPEAQWASPGRTTR